MNLNGINKLPRDLATPLAWLNRGVKHFQIPFIRVSLRQAKEISQDYSKTPTLQANTK
jgi:hypothetical protein